MISIYNNDELTTELSKITETDENVTKFYKEFVFENIISSNNINSLKLFKDATETETNSKKIINLLNKINSSNVTKTISTIKEIHFKSLLELQELVNLCIQKIKRESDQIKPLIGTLCYELLAIYFVDENEEKNYFRKLLLTSVKNDYFNNINYNDNKWTKENGIKSISVIGILYNSNVISDELLLSVFNDFKKNIEYKIDFDEIYLSCVEKSVQLLIYLLSTLISNGNITEMCVEMEKFMTHQISLYKENKKIGKKCCLEMLSCVDALKKLY